MPSSPGQWVEFNVTDDVNAMVNLGIDNYG